MQSLGYYGKVVDCAMTSPGLSPASTPTLVDEPHMAGRVRPRDRPSSAKPPAPTALEVPKMRQRPMSAALVIKKPQQAQMSGPYAVLLKHKAAPGSGKAWAQSAGQAESAAAAAAAAADGSMSDPMIPSFDDDDEDDPSWDGSDQPSCEAIIEEATPSPAARFRARRTNMQGGQQQRRSPSLGSPRRVKIRAPPSPISAMHQTNGSNDKENRLPRENSPKRGRGAAKCEKQAGGTSSTSTSVVLPPATRVKARRVLDTGGAKGEGGAGGNISSNLTAASRARSASPSLAPGSSSRAGGGVSGACGNNKGDLTSSREEMEKLLKELTRRVETSDGQHRTTREESNSLRRQLMEARDAQDSLSNELARMNHLAEQYKCEKVRAGETRVRLEAQVAELSEENQRLSERVREMTEIACRRTREHEEEVCAARAAVCARDDAGEAERDALRRACEDAVAARQESERELAAERARLGKLLDEAHEHMRGEEERQRPYAATAARRAAAALEGARRRETIRQALAAWEDAVINYPSDGRRSRPRQPAADLFASSLPLPMKQQQTRTPPVHHIKAGTDGARGTPMSAGDSAASAMSTPRVWQGKGSSPDASSTSSGASSFLGATPRSARREGGWACEVVAEADVSGVGAGVGDILSGEGGLVGDVRRLDALFENCLSQGRAPQQKRDGLAGEQGPICFQAAADPAFDTSLEAVAPPGGRSGKCASPTHCALNVSVETAFHAWRAEVKRQGRIRRIVSRLECRRQANTMAGAFMGWADVA